MNKCEECQQTFASKDNLQRHLKTVHSSELHLCEVCGGAYSNKRKLKYHQLKCHVPSAVVVPQASKRMKMNNDARDIYKAAKINFDLFALYTKFKLDDSVNISKLISFNTKNKVITEASDLDNLFSELVSELKTQSENFQTQDSGWAIEKIKFIEVNINKYNPLRASSYIDLPQFIKAKKAIINVQNDDQACFAWSIMAAKYPTTKNPHRTTSYPHYSSELILNDISFPMALKCIPKFEHLNNISINVYSLEGNQIVGPLYFSNNKKNFHVNLLFLEDGINSHYCLIKSFSRLVGTQLSKRSNKKFICDGCLLFFRNENDLNCHVAYGCNKIKCILPNDNNSILMFKNIQNKQRVPFVIYCDFEALLKPICTCLPNTKNPFTENIIKHEPYSFSYYIKCSYDDNLSKLELYRGKESCKIFVAKLKTDLQIIYNELHKNKKMIPLTIDEQLVFEKSSTCYMCNKSFDDVTNCKVRDHSHLTGKFRGAAHTKCNLKYKIVDFVPIVCHNLSGYDAHFIIKELGFDNEAIDLIAQNKEKYISFTKHFRLENNDKIKLRFIDSFKFMSSSIDNLAKNLEDHQFNEIHKYFPNENEFNLIRKKGIFPYEFLDSYEKFNYMLPPQSSFYSKLNDSNITDDQYNHASKVWTEFNCKNLGDYSDLF